MLYQWQDKKPTYQVPFTGWIADNASVIGDVHLGDGVVFLQGDPGGFAVGRDGDVLRFEVL